MFQNVFTQCLQAQREEILLVGDIGYPTRRVPALVLGCYLLAAKRLNLSHKFVVQKPKEVGENAEEEIVESLLGLPDNNVIVWALSGRVGSMSIVGNSFRKHAHKHNHRFISTPSLGVLRTSSFKDLVKAIDVDYASFKQTGRELKDKLDAGSEVKIATDKGTNLTFDIKLKKAIANDGNFTAPGSGGNIPAGEVYVPPRKKGVNGIVFIDACSRNVKSSIVVKEPIKMTIQEGVITNIEGGQEAKALEESLEWAEAHAKYPWGIRRIGELGIGMNPNARITESTLISEKMLGTAHIAIGSNYWFGGTIFAIIHLDQVFMKPKIWIDGEEVKV